MSLPSLRNLNAVLSKFLLIALVTLTFVTERASAVSSEVSNTASRLSGHVLPALQNASISRTANSPPPMTLTFILTRDDEVGFQQYLQDVYDPRSSDFRHFLTPVQVAERFGPSQASFDEVVAFVSAQHLEVIEAPANRLTITATGARADAERALGVHIDDYTIGGKAFFANDRDPQLPSHVAAHVQAIAGMTNLATPQPAVKQWPSGPAGQATWYALCANYAINGGPINGAIGSGIFTATIFDAIAFSELIAVLNLLDAAVNIAQASDLSSSGTGQQYLQCVNSYNNSHGYPALGRPAIASMGSPLVAAGTGQTVGLLEFDTYLPSDVQDYVTLMGTFSGPATNVTQINVNGGAVLGAGQDEVLLDIADVLTAAPGAAIVVYDAPPSTSYQALFNAMISGGVDVISNSWTYCEDQTTLADVTSIDSILQTAAASGISVFNGAGDTGSTCLDGNANTIGVPADSPHATAVGGTSRQSYPGFTYGTETWWNGSNDTPATGQGGFGVSRFFARPSYQNGATSSAARSVPDVATNADPRYGVVICQASAGGCPTGAFFGGTSSATPIWAANAAVLNQVNGSDFGFLNPQIYPLGASLAFHGPSSMGTDFAHVGLGSPNLIRLYMNLAGKTAGVVSPTISTVRAFAQTTYSPPAGSGLPTLAFADGINQTFVVVTLLDANGFPVGGKNVTLTASVGGTQVFTGSITADMSSGVALFYVKDTTPRTLTISATDSTDGVPLTQTASIQFIVPPATGGSISAFTDAEPADGASTDLITVTLVDAQSRPTPGKSVMLSTLGSSLVVGANPAVTDANGNAQFDVSDTVQETVAYTAIDLTDGNMAVPGSATVTFNASGGDNCGMTYDVNGTPTIGPGPGYAMTPYATGFVPLVTNGGGLTNGCRGASGIAFDSSGNLFVGDQHTGNVYKFPPGGGVADATTLITPTGLGPNLESLTFGSDGKLYGALNYTTGNFTTGAVIEINPATGALVRTVASPITCASFVTTDPVSGDLFVDDSCAGGGSENGSVWRISNPSGPSPTLSVYASTPGVNGGLSFAPGGTLYILSYRDNGGAGGVAKIAGTDSASPGQVTVVPGITAPALGVVATGTEANGDAESLILAANTPDGFTTGIRSFDLTTNPATTSSLVMQDLYANVQVLGPDKCMYASVAVTVYRVTNADGTCPLAVNDALLTLSPATAPTSLVQSGSSDFTVTLHNATAPIGTPVYFAVTGPNGQLSQALMDANGQATFDLAGVNTGTDTVTASATINDINVKSNPAYVTWTSGPHSTLLTFDPGPNSGKASFPTPVVATLHDGSVQPSVPIAGATILFNLSGLGCSGVTDANGIARCNLTIPFVGTSTLTANYSGTAAYSPSQASELFTTSDRIFADGFEGLR